MDQKLEVRNSVHINAPVAMVWDALVNPVQTRIYMFGCETVSEWIPGSPLLWQAEYEGKNMVFVKGNIIAIEPGKLLVYTVTDPNASWEDIPENYLTVSYHLVAENEGCFLTVVQEGFEHAAEGQRRYEEVSNHGDGWNPILIQIKKLVEEEYIQSLQ